MGRQALFLCIALLLACAAQAQAADVIAVESRQTAISADGGWAVWSRHIGPKAARRWVLMGSRDGGIATRLKVRPRRVPFDADVGADARGRPVVVYSRCGIEPREPILISELPYYAEAKRCDVFALDLDTQVERRLDAVSPRRSSEYLPTISGSRIAFVRRYDRLRGLPGRLPHVMLGRVDGTDAVELPGGPTGRYFSEDDIGFLVENGGPGPVQLDLRNTDLSMAWGFMPGEEKVGGYGCVEDYDSAFDQPYVIDILHVRAGDRRATRLARSCTLSAENRFVAANVIAGSGGATTYLSGRFRLKPDGGLCAASELVRARPGVGRRATAPMAETPLWFAADGRTLYGVNYRNDAYVITRSEAPRFDRDVPASLACEK